MYLSFFLEDDTANIKDVTIAINKLHIHSPYFDLSLCHELGHLKYVFKLKSKNREIVPLETLWQNIVYEITADNEAAKIYNRPKLVTKKDMICWHAGKIRSLLSEIMIQEQRDGIWKDIALNTARFIATIGRF